MKYIALFIAFIISAKHPNLQSKCDAKYFYNDIIIKEKDLIPEGIAYNNKTKTIYISSTHKQKIIAIDAAGHVTDFIKEGEYGLGSVIGMEADVKRNHLWVNSCFAESVLPIKNPAASKKWKSSVYCFDAVTGKLIKKVALEADSSFLNDITVLNNGDVYVTESTGNKVYRLRKGGNRLELLLSTPEYKFLNGITASAGNESLFVSSTQGIIKINLAAKHYTLLAVKDSINAMRIDGLALYKNMLIGHQSKKITLFFLDKKQETITGSMLLDSGPEFDGSTTGEIGGTDYYYIVNSQISSGVDYANQKIKPYEMLKNVIIRKKSLKQIKSYIPKQDEKL